MKDKNLHKAIKDMPQFEAPDVWENIEKNIKPVKKNRVLPIILISVVSLIAVYLIIDNFVLIDENESNDVSLIAQDISYNKIDYFPERLDTNIIYTEAGDSQISQMSLDLKIEDFESAQLLTNLNIDNSTTTDIGDIEYVNEIEPVSDIIVEERLIYVEKGENLVVNPSFEDFRICPAGIVGNPSRRLIPDWQVPNRGTPDYFNVCSKKDAGVPENFAGSVQAHSGDGYVGMILRQNFTRDNKITGEKAVIYREYIQNELKEKLEAGKTYKITFWVCNASNSRFAVDGIGACVTQENEWTRHKEVLEIIPVVENSPGNVLMNQNYWVKIDGYYTAQGGEQFLTIGNFRNNFSTNYMMQDNASAFNYSYYYIDDVSVIEVEEEVETYIIDKSFETSINEDNISLVENEETDW